jgi:Fe-S-cluster-containing dehydrogenase component
VDDRQKRRSLADSPTPGVSRRSFFSLVGATAAVAANVACQRKGEPIVVPYTRRPQEVVPGVANYYASTFSEGYRSYPVLVKTREGRPIHITGNDEHPAFAGKTSPRALADVLRLYDPDRLRGPKMGHRPASWAEVEHTLIAAVVAAKRQGKSVLLLTGAVSSPTRRALLSDLKAALPAIEHVAWEPAAGAGAQEGARAAFGICTQILPRLDAATIILSLGADFLNGEDPRAIAAFAAKRRPIEPVASMSRLWVLEGALSLTGTNADHRFPVRPSRIAALAFALARELHDRHGLPMPAGATLPSTAGASMGREGIPTAAWNKLVEDLRSAGREAVVLCGDTLPAEAHVATHLLNAMLDSRGVELLTSEPLATQRDLQVVVQGMASGRYATAIFWGANPVYAFPKALEFKAALEKVPTRAWIGLIEDETAAECELVLPEHHWLEAWGDYGSDGLYTLQQPAVGPLYDSRQGEDLILGLMTGLGVAAWPDYHAYLQARWSRQVQPSDSPVPFKRFFEAALHDGVVRVDEPIAARPAFLASCVAAAAQRATEGSADQGFELEMRPATQIYDGRYANSNWLQELPDPVTKLTWGNPVSISATDARQLGLTDGDLVELEAGGVRLSVPVLVQPGQAKGVLALNLGYGRSVGGVAKGVGVNAFPLLDGDPAVSNLRRGVKLTKVRGRVDLAYTQRHYRMAGRDLARSSTLAEFAEQDRKPKVEPDLATLYPALQFPEHKWGMVIDLAACVGCSTCVLACQSENNIPTVGPQQVAKGREMHWIRVDQYFEGSLENPRVLHQPILCQHCDAAPCESVCPVNATNHSSDGLNQQAYNRCVGTRYCANNCPYKVRRFNFFEHNAEKTEPETLVFNPEVTARPRGVMEKCSFCVQRIQDARMRAKAEHRGVKDGEITPACVAACPAQAIVFGNLKDPDSRVGRLLKVKRGYKVLEELGTRPSITYLADLKNPAAEGGFHE